MVGIVILLPLYHLEYWYQLHGQQGTSVLGCGHFQLPSMRESSDREKETTQVNQKSADFHPSNLVCNLVTRHQGYAYPACNFHIVQNLFSSHSSMSLFTVEHTYCTRSLVHSAMMYHPMLCTWGWDGQWNPYVEGQVLNLKLAVRCYYQKYSFTYPLVIFDVHVSSFPNKASQGEVTTFASCNMQGSQLIEESNKI